MAESVRLTAMKTAIKDAMTSMNISLPESMKKFVEEEVAVGGYGTTSEFFRELLREAKKKRAEERLEQLLLEGVESGKATPMTKKNWEAIKKRGLERLRNKKAK